VRNWLVDATSGRILSHADDEAQTRWIVRHCLQRRATALDWTGVVDQLRELTEPSRSTRPWDQHYNSHSIVTMLVEPSTGWCELSRLRGALSGGRSGESS